MVAGPDNDVDNNDGDNDDVNEHNDHNDGDGTARLDLLIFWFEMVAGPERAKTEL